MCIKVLAYTGAPALVDFDLKNELEKDTKQL